MKYIIGLILMVAAMHSNAQDNCDIENPDPKGYLSKICKYIIENEIDVSPGKPNKYQIRKIAGTIHKEKTALLIHLSCCYLGDIAIIDPETQKVIQFNLGAK